MKKKRKKYSSKKTSLKPNENRRIRIVLLLSASLLLLLFVLIYIFLGDTVGKTEELKGVVIALQQSPGSSAKSYTVIRLSDNSIIRIESLRLGAYKKGRKVLIVKKISKKYRRISYDFKRYLD